MEIFSIPYPIGQRILLNYASWPNNIVITDGNSRQNTHLTTYPYVRDNRLILSIWVNRQTFPYFPIILIIFYIIGSVLELIFSFSVTSGATTPIKSCSMRGTSGCKSYLDRLSSCKVYHICCVDTEEDQHDLCRFYPSSNLSQTIMLLLSSKRAFHCCSSNACKFSFGSVLNFILSSSSFLSEWGSIPFSLQKVLLSLPE